MNAVMPLVLTMAFCPSHDQQQILQHLAMGDRLIGPVTVTEARSAGGIYHRHRPWGFSSGIRTKRSSVEALGRRGLIAIEHQADGTRAARLVREALPS
jgi:hypothetical protein